MRKKSPAITAAEYEALAALRYALRRFLRFSEEAARAAALSPQQHQALLAIKGCPPGRRLSVGQLAEHLQIRSHSAVGLVNRLVARRLAKRQPGTADRRQALLALTRRGENVLSKLSAAHREQLRRVAPQLQALLDRLLA